MGERLIRAAGGVLWRRSPEGVDVALVHRPGHDDWSLPKGTLARGEHPITAAYREVTGKTGVRPVLGRRLPTQRCRTVNGPKMVEYWTVRGQDGGFTATVEVDQRVWLSLPRARARLTYPGDAELLNALSIAVAVDAVVLVVRHGSAGDPGRWTGDDRLRPLDAVGRREARAVQRILPAFAPARLLSVPNSRCRDTLALLAADLGLLVESEQRLEEQRYAGQRAAGVRRIRELARDGGTPVVCSQGTAIPDLIASLARHDGVTLTGIRAKRAGCGRCSFAAQYSRPPTTPPARSSSPTANQPEPICRSRSDPARRTGSRRR